MQRNENDNVFNSKIVNEKHVNIHAKLLDQCRQGNTKAQFEIYKLYYKAMYNTSYRILENEAEAEDVMQEAFLSAFEHLAEYKGEVAFGAWLKRIVVNKSLDELRKRKIEFAEVEDNTLVDDETQYQDEEETSISMKQIMDAIEKLPNGYKVILTLNLLEGYDHEEISQILGITESASRSQLSRAKVKLQELLSANLRKPLTL